MTQSEINKRRSELMLLKIHINSHYTTNVFDIELSREKYLLKKVQLATLIQRDRKLNQVLSRLK